jgi:hypothetical protein
MLPWLLPDAQCAAERRAEGMVESEMHVNIHTDLASGVTTDFGSRSTIPLILASTTKQSLSSSFSSVSSLPKRFDCLLFVERNGIEATILLVRPSGQIKHTELNYTWVCTNLQVQLKDYHGPNQTILHTEFYRQRAQVCRGGYL